MCFIILFAAQFRNTKTNGVIKHREPFQQLNDHRAPGAGAAAGEVTAAIRNMKDKMVFALREYLLTAGMFFNCFLHHVLINNA